MGQFLVTWEGLPDDEATWVDEDNFQSQFPDFRLEDKAHLKGEGNVTVVEEEEGRRLLGLEFDAWLYSALFMLDYLLNYRGLVFHMLY